MTNTCIHLDGTTGVQCAFQGPYKWNSRNRPSLAKSAIGDSYTLGKLFKNTPFLMCTPAEELYTHLNDNQLAEAQSHCTQYKERE